jgi:hypothetical protein
MKRTARRTMKRTTRRTMKRTARRTTKRTARRTTKRTARRTTKRTARRTMKRTTRRTTKRPTRKSMKRTMKRTTPQRVSKKRPIRTAKKNIKKMPKNPIVLSQFISSLMDSNMKGKLFEMVDGHMVIDPPISKEKHLGSCASEKDHYWNYAGTLNFLRFFNKISKKLPNNLLCFPELTGPTKLSYQIKIDHELYRDYKSMNINLPDYYFINHYYRKLNIKKEINLCIKKGCRFICLDIDLRLEVGGHANMILIDTKEKTIELFEPHGGLDRSSAGWYKDISNIFKSYFKKYFPKYKYVPPHKILPIDGPQTRIYGKFCMSWTSLYLHYKLLNKDVPSKTIVKRILQLNRSFLLRYIQYIEDVIKGKITDYYEPRILSEGFKNELKKESKRIKSI